MDIRVDSQATVDGVVQGRPPLPEGQNQPRPVPPTNYPGTQSSLIRIY